MAPVASKLIRGMSRTGLWTPKRGVLKRGRSKARGHFLGQFLGEKGKNLRKKRLPWAEANQPKKARLQAPQSSAWDRAGTLGSGKVPPAF